MRVNGLDSRLAAGTYTLAPSMTLREIVETMTRPQAAAVSVTIREGWRLEQAADYLEPARATWCGGSRPLPHAGSRRRPERTGRKPLSVPASQAGRRKPGRLPLPGHLPRPGRGRHGHRRAGAPARHLCRSHRAALPGSARRRGHATHPARGSDAGIDCRAGSRGAGRTSSHRRRLSQPAATGDETGRRPDGAVRNGLPAAKRPVVEDAGLAGRILLRSTARTTPISIPGCRRGRLRRRG